MPLLSLSVQRDAMAKWRGGSFEPDSTVAPSVPSHSISVITKSPTKRISSDAFAFARANPNTPSHLSNTVPYTIESIRDPTSRRLEIRSALTECPTCHQSLRHPQSPEHEFTHPPDINNNDIHPDYFRMLRDRHANFAASRPSSPVRRIFPINGLPDSSTSAAADEDSGSDVFSEPGPSTTFSEHQQSPRSSGIRREAFSQNYFNTFFVEEKELGRGGKGVVLLVRHQIDGCALGNFACKRVPVGDDHAWLEKVLVEVELLAKLQHPNLVSYRHVWLENYKVNNFGPSVACAFILQQYCNGGDLLHYVIGDNMRREPTNEQLKAQMRRRSKGQAEKPAFSQRHLLSYEEIFSLFRDITAGLAYLHQANYIHRDLKPSNCLLHKEGSNIVCLISDFGEVQPENVDRASTGATGTISYCAPEVLKQDLLTGRYNNFTYKSDVFSLGMILYFMCFGRLPYRSANAVQEELEDIDELRDEISSWKGFQDERRERPDLPAKLYHLLKKLLSLSPVERPSANEVLAAMKSESYMDGISRIPRGSSPSIGLASRRIQNLDSPVPPSTPIPDPTKQFRPARVSQDSDDSPESKSGGVASPSPQPTPQNTLQKVGLPGAPRLRSQAMAVTRSHDGLARSPERHRTMSQSPTRQRPPHSPRANTPLLMPPPTTLAEDLYHRTLVQMHNIRRRLTGPQSSLVFIIRDEGVYDGNVMEHYPSLLPLLDTLGWLQLGIVVSDPSGRLG
ncbi:calcium-dependent protein kinase [Zalerion maritima]|uniref:non-specific serine/threonine protein kinase n=1 Tax=Zalerion maritima TaxID=339359 RepID=A0AAD5RXF6_9PEZI|nr:calcium-dependent protein kinase [Zalerion maritima]